MPRGTARLAPEHQLELSARLGRKVRPLSVGRSAAGPVVGLAMGLAFIKDGDWHVQPWHEIEYGRWDPQHQVLAWRGASGAEFALELLQAASLPDLFNERVAASIAFRHHVRLAEGGEAIITARTDLASTSTSLVWSVVPAQGTTAAQVERDPDVQQVLERLKVEFGLT